VAGVETQCCSLQILRSSEWNAGVAGLKSLQLGNRIFLTHALLPAFSPGEKENYWPFRAKTCDWAGLVTIELSADGQTLFPLLGERVRVRAVVARFAGALANPPQRIAKAGCSAA